MNVPSLTLPTSVTKPTRKLWPGKLTGARTEGDGDAEGDGDVGRAAEADTKVGVGAIGATGVALAGEVLLDP